VRRTGTALLSAATLLAASMGLAACGAESDARAGGSAGGCPKGPINYWAEMPLSGPVGTVGAAIEGGLKAGVNQINQNGGVLGHQIKLTVEDTGADPTKAVSNIQTMLAQPEKPTIVIPGILSTEVLAGLPLVNNAKLVSVVVTSDPASSDAQKFPYTFNLGTTSTPSSIPALVALLQAKGYKKYGIAVSDDATGAAQVAELEGLSKTDGFTVTSVKIPLTTTDPTPQLSKLKATGPDVLIYGTGPGPLTPATLTARNTMGWSIPAHGTSTSASAPLKGLSAATLKDVTFTAPKFGIAGSEAQQTDTFQTYQAALVAQFGGADKLIFGPELYSNPYSMAIASAAAIEKAGSCDSSKVAAAFQSLTTKDVPLWFESAEFGFPEGSHGLHYAPEDYEAIPADSQISGGSFVVH
jgi:branched-chain amino acid transport system substrate-binding protein